MSEEVFDAELVETGDVDFTESFLSTGKVDIGKSRFFRYLWFFGVYIAFALPYAFYNQWALTVGVNDFGLDKDIIVPLFMATQIPFFLRPVWGSVVDKRTSISFGRRRSWILIGVIGHIGLLIPLAFIPLASSPTLWVAMLALALIPRVIAEQGIAGLMVDYLPDPGAIGATIAYAFRIGASVIPGLIIMGWWIGGVPMDSPFLDSAGDVDLSGVLFASNILIAVGLVGALLLVILMKEGKHLRGPGQSGPVAISIEEAQEDPELNWPENTPWSTKIKAAFSSRTSRLCLLVALLVPLGDGFETWFRYYFLEELDWSTTRWAGWSWLFVIAGFLGLIGPAISDFIDRRKALMAFSVAAMFSYLLLGGAMLTGMSWGLVMTTWVLVLITTDWLIFTFMASIIEISDPRIAATHMGVYQSVQAISSTTLMVLLGQLILKLTNDSYGTLYLLAAAGPLIGYLLFKEMQLSDSSQKNLSDARKALVSGTDKMLIKVPGFDSLEGQRRSTMMAVAWGFIGLVLVATVAASSTAMSSDYESSEETWSLGFRGVSHWTELSFTLGPGDSDSYTYLHEDNAMLSISVVSQSPSCSSTVGQVQYTITLTSPTELVNAGGMSVEEQGSGSLSIADNTELTIEENFTAPTKEELQAQVDSVIEADNWSTGNGEWVIDIERAGSGPQNALSSCQFSVTWQYSYAYDPIPRDFIVNQTIETKSKDFGPAFIGAVGGPIILATPILAWLVARPLED
ncbi:MAG TPA: hypothetical protein EYQ85_02030 [Candidatus Poseidoniales archaeon]|jgi:hypothetical protein|nr:MAG: hypothetical protein CXT68_05795 [Euryarchaeota archaeon]HIF16016.1 hypothetical protein [Candidatus Poseidoniales archaeon]